MAERGGFYSRPFPLWLRLLYFCLLATRGRSVTGTCHPSPLYVRLRQARSTEPWGFKSLFQYKNRRCINAPSVFMAERGGFYSRPFPLWLRLLYFCLLATRGRSVTGTCHPSPLYVRLRQARSTEPWGFKSLFQYKNRRCINAPSVFMAERGGFEPPHGCYPPAGIRSQSLQPLGYLSTNALSYESNYQYMFG